MRYKLAPRINPPFRYDILDDEAGVNISVAAFNDFDMCKRVLRYLNAMNTVIELFYEDLDEELDLANVTV